MGTDVVLYVEGVTKEEAEAKSQAYYDLLRPTDGWAHYPGLEHREAATYYSFPGSTWKAPAHANANNDGMRYYWPYGGRGFWPRIAEAIGYLQDLLPDGQIYYTTDSSYLGWPGVLVTQDFMGSMWAAWYGHLDREGKEYDIYER